MSYRVFKTVRVYEDGAIRSCVLRGGAHCIDYRVGSLVLPNGGWAGNYGILAFDDLVAAIALGNTMHEDVGGDYAVFVSEGFGKLDLRDYPMRTVYTASDGTLDVGNIPANHGRWPEHTVMFRAIRLNTVRWATNKASGYLVMAGVKDQYQSL